MKLQDIVEALGGQVICGKERLDDKVEAGFAPDLMSDVLTLQANNLTVPVNVQTICSAEISDYLYCIST
jgi:hypothetical protein